MRTNVRETSRIAYATEQPTIGKQEREVLEVIIKRKTATIAEIAAVLNLEKSSVSARVNKLKGGKQLANGEMQYTPIVREVVGPKRPCGVTKHLAISVELIPAPNAVQPEIIVGTYGQRAWSM